MQGATMVPPANIPADDSCRGEKRPRPHSLSYVFSKLTLTPNKRATLNDFNTMTDKHSTLPRPFHPTAVLEALRWSSQDNSSNRSSRQARKSFSLRRRAGRDSHETRTGSSSSASTHDHHINWTPPSTDWTIMNSPILSVGSDYNLAEDQDEDCEAATYQNEEHFDSDDDDDDDAKSAILWAFDEPEASPQGEVTPAHRDASSMIHPALRNRSYETPTSTAPSTPVSKMTNSLPRTLPKFSPFGASPTTAASSQTTLDASSPPRTDIYSWSDNKILPPRPKLRLQPGRGLMTSATTTATSSPTQKFNLLLGGPVHSFYGGDANGSRIVLSSPTSPQTPDSRDQSSAQSYRQLVDTYRELAEPGRSVFDDDDDEKAASSTAASKAGKAADANNAVRFAPLPMFWSKAANGQQITSDNSPTKKVRRTPSAYYHTTHKSLKARASAVLQPALSHSQSDATLSSRRAKGSLVISQPISMDDATYSAVVRDHKDAITLSPASSTLNSAPVSPAFAPAPVSPMLGDAAEIVAADQTNKKPWHQKWSPSARKLGVSIDDVRASMLHRVSSSRLNAPSVRTSIDPAGSDDLSPAAMRQDALDKLNNAYPCNKPLPASPPNESGASSPTSASGEARDGTRMHSKNFGVFLERVRQQNMDKQCRRRTQVLRGEIVPVEQVDAELVLPHLGTLEE